LQLEEDCGASLGSPNCDPPIETLELIKNRTSHFFLGGEGIPLSGDDRLLSLSPSRAASAHWLLLALATRLLRIKSVVDHPPCGSIIDPCDHHRCILPVCVNRQRVDYSLLLEEVGRTLLHNDVHLDCR
jgi:hypothetical protein